MSKSTLWIAFSGGLDSHVLLDYLSRYYSHNNNINLKAIHINHQLISDAKQWEKHCRNICKNLDIPLKIIRVNIIKKSGESLEAKAREARYNAFKKILNKNDLLFTAHHQEDQAETFILQLLRGAGLRGVSAMPEIAKLGKGFLLRPLLNFSRKNLLTYAKYYQLNYIQDPSNNDQKFDRNYLRHKIFPVLKSRWPQCDKIFSRFSKHCAEQEKLLMILAEKDYQLCHGEYPDSLLISKFKLLSKSRQKNLLRYFINKLNFNLPSEKILHELLRLCEARKDKNPVVIWADAECRRFRNHLFIFSPLKSHSPELSQEQKIWCKTNLNINLNNKFITITYRKGGEKFKPKNNKYTKTLKNLFQEWEIPPWLRDSIPLIYYKKVLIGVVGYASLHLQK
jgi:tRNA(Ile)-lysidine synthase